MTGYISEERKFQYPSVSNCYALSSLHEGFGIVLQEAMQLGLPIVATDSGGQIDLIDDGINGLLVQPKDAKALAEKIALFQSNKPMAKKMGMTGFNLLENYSPMIVAKDYLDLLN